MNQIQKFKKIAVYTSGGDAPGMNAALRAVVRTAIDNNIEVIGISNGYIGMLAGNFAILNRRSMANILQRGGTILKSGRSPAFMRGPEREKAYDHLKKNGIEGLVCIGGDGSFRGAQAIWNELKLPIMGVPGTIDNDIYGTDSTIGFDTAVNTALEAIDKIRDTAASHDRLFIVEVMGRDSGFIAAHVGIAGGAEEIFVPENPTNIDETINRIKKSLDVGKLSSILITAEGQKPGRAYDLAEAIRKKAGFEARVCILGHIQRGGAPTAADRILASRLGSAAVEGLLGGEHGKMVGIQSGEIKFVPFDEVFSNKKPLNKDLLTLARTLSY